jgi:polyisoprenoid-binding protein YceI
MNWQIDASHSHVGFSVKHMMIATVRGTFEKYSGTLELNTDDLTQSKIEGEIEVTSINTREENRDQHLRSGDFFDAENHPKILFKSTKIEHVEGNEYKVTGDITIRGVTKPIVLDAEFAGVHKDPWGGTRTGFTVTGSLNRKDFGVNFNAALETGGVLVGDKVKLELEVEAVLETAPAPAAV